jgi:hypothetical protein
MPAQEDIDHRFTYHPPVGEQPTIYSLIRQQGREFATAINALVGADSRELSLAITKIEEAVMWANAAVAQGAVPDA